MILLDTDHLSVLLDERDEKHSRLYSRLQNADDELSIPIVCIEEQLRGWLSKIRHVNDPHREIVPYRRLRLIFTLLREWAIADWEESAADRFTELRRLRLRIGTHDLKIACTALAYDALLLSANLRDFHQVPELKVEDWLH